jgi:2-polyprenyl-3-methyl-5-hydroxy-6-metoxy-1,4-benzoquinol methylase
MKQYFRKKMQKIFKSFLARHQGLPVHDNQGFPIINNDLQLIKEQVRFLLYEIQRVEEAFRYHQIDKIGASAQRLQTVSSFEYQWAHFGSGVGMPNDVSFMKNIESHVCEITGLPREWFLNKKVADIGCGAGRYSYALLSLGAHVTACDQSLSALKNTAKLCDRFCDRLSQEHINLLEWGEAREFDLAFCFGVTHHTGNTFLAIDNVCRKVKPGGRVFLMIYGMPLTHGEFEELNAYENLRQALRTMSFEEKKAYLIEKKGEHLAHGWFDAISPAINDLLTFSEIYDLLSGLGFSNVKRTIAGRNHHVIGDKIIN